MDIENQEPLEQKKEVDVMALAQRINSAYIISGGKEESFFKKINENRPTAEFWDECKQLRKNVNQASIDELNALMDKED